MNTTIAGINSEIIGNPNRDLILSGRSVKIQWGNRYIDLLKNGKINNSSESIFKIVNSENDIAGNGIYLLTSTQEIYISIDGIKLNLGKNSNNDK